MPLNTTRRAAWREYYRHLLADDVLPFWLRHAPDEEAGGYATCLDRDGRVYDYDKRCMWSQGRLSWTFSYLYNEWEPRPEWLAMAARGVDFIRRHAFDPAGDAWYALTRTGRPLEPPRDVFAALSSVCALTEYARATADRPLHEEARRIFNRAWERLRTPGAAWQPFLAAARPVRLHGHAMITLNVLQELRRFAPDPRLDAMADTCVDDILDCHLRADRRLVLELVAWDGGDLPGYPGRWVCPGHMMECGIFLIHEGQSRQRPELLAHGARFIDWGFACGWDEEYGGIYNDIDCDRQPVPDAAALRYPCKLWWQHAEALYALLLAATVTGENRFEAAHEQVLAYARDHFADPAHGEWFGYLDRRGHRLNDAKGMDRKTAYHLARNVFHAWRLLNDRLPAGDDRGKKPPP